MVATREGVQPAMGDVEVFSSRHAQKFLRALCFRIGVFSPLSLKCDSGDRIEGTSDGREGLFTTA